MIKRNKINRNKVKSGMSRRKKILLSAMVASSLLFADGLYTTYVYADGGQEIHGISVNVDPGGEPGNNYNNDGAGYLGVAIGNRASSLAGYGTAIGPYAKADALYSNATGFWAQALGQYSAAYGAGARAINNFGVAFGQGSVVSFGKPISEAEYSVYPEIIKKLYTAVKTETGTTVYYQTKILLQNGSIQDKSVFSVAIGASAAATDNYAVAIGFKSSADEMGSLSIGAYSEAKGKQGLALGYVAKAIGDFSTAVGQWSQANGDHAVAIGYGAITEKNQAGVAIGYESHSMRAGGNGWNPITDQVWDGSEAQIEALGLKEKVKALDEEIAQKQALEQQAKEELAKFPNDPDLIEKARVAHNEKAKADEKKNKLFATWKTPTGDVAVGNSDTGMTRQITGVAAGSEDTDAVNVAQLKALNRKNVTQLNALNSKVDTFDNKIENIKNIANGNKIHYFSVGPDNEKNYPAGENYNNDGVEQHGGIAIGFDASSKDGDGIAIGKSAQARGWESTGIGALTYSIGDFSTSIGTRAQAFGKSASAYGALARAYGANGVAIGTGSLVASKKSITKAEFDVLSEEQKALYNIDKVNPKEFYQYRIRAKDGDIKDIETNGTAVGNYAESIGIGGVAVGDHAKSSDINNVNGSNFGVAIGAYSQNKVAQGVALGAVSVSDREGNIRGYLPTKNGIIENFEDAMEAVGKGKEFTELKNEYAQLQEQMNAAKAAYDRDPTNTDLKTKYEQEKQKFDALTNKYAIMTAPWTSRKGAVSIGNDKKGQTRQLIGVAAGSEDTDAVNVAQLKALNDKVDKGSIHYFSVNSGKPAKLDGTNWSNDGAIGEDAVAIGNRAKAQGKYSTALGTGAKAQGYYSTALGSGAQAKTYHSTALGHGAIAKGDSSTALGYGAEAQGYSSMALGKGVIAQGSYSTALGDGAQARVDGSVALGEGTVAGREAGTVGYLASAGGTTFDDVLNALGKKTEYNNWKNKIDESKAEYNRLTNAYFNASESGKAAAKTALETWKVNHKEFLDALEKKSKLEATWKATKAAVSVGADGLDEVGNRIIESRQITNVAAGTQDTDAVNVAQLKALNSKVTTNTGDITTLKKGWTLEDGNTGTKTVKAEGTVKVTGDEYITATVNSDGLTLGMNVTKLNTQINDQIDNSETVKAKMNSWVLKAATTDKDPAAKGQTIDNTNNVATFDVETGQGLTVARNGATIKYGVNNTQLVKNINDGDTAVTNISAKFSVTDGTNTKAVNLGKDKNNNVKFLGTAGETTVTVGGNDDAPTVTVGLDAAFKKQVTDNTSNIDVNKNAIAKNAGDITTNKNAIAKNAGDITTNKNAIAKNAGDITTNKNAIAKNTGDITTLTGRVDTTETTIKSNTDRITTAETTIKSNTDRITTAETTIKSNTDRIEKNATDIAGKMTSWTVKAGAEDADGQKIDNTNNEVTFNATGAGLTVERKDSTITYGIDGSKIDLSNNKSLDKLKTTVKAGDGEKNISVVKDSNKEEYTLTLAKDLKGLDSVSATTVNAGTVKADTVDTKTVTVGDKVTLGTTGFTIKDGPSVTAAGIDAGNNKITGVAAGAVSEKSTEAVNGGQLFGVEQKVNINNQNIAILGGKVGELGNRVNRVGAGAAALAALHPLDFDPYNRSQIMAGVSTYKGQEAIALGLAYYSNENTLLHAGLSYAGSSELMANAGISYRFGSSYDRKFLEERNKLMPQYKGGVISSVYVMQDEMTKLQKENEILKEKNAKAEAENKEMKSELEILKKQVSKLMEKI